MIRNFPPNISTIIIPISGFMLLLLVNIYFLFYQIVYPPCCDAENYIALAKSFISNGIFETESSLRTFAYPWLLSLFLQVSYFFNIGSVFIVFFFQFFSYFLVICYTTRKFSHISPSCANYVYIALCANFFLAPYLSVSMTDGLYTVLSILILVLLINFEVIEKKMYSLVAFTGFLIAFSIVIRPSSIWLTVPYFYCLAMLFLSGKLRMFPLLVCLLPAAIPLVYQCLLNHHQFGKFSFFPAVSIGSSQIQWGLENIKYSTWLGDGNIQNFYSSRNLITPPEHPEGLSWYLSNPIDGAKLICIKLIGAFDFDYLVPYPYQSLHYSWLATFISFSLLIVASIGSIFHAVSGKLTLLGHRFLPLVIIMSWAGLNLVSAVELRFTLPLLSYFLIVTVITLDTFVKQRRYVFGLFGVWAFAMPFLFTGAQFIREQSTNIVPQVIQPMNSGLLRN